MTTPPNATPPTDEAADRPAFVGHARTVMVLTLASRIFGLVRDAICSRIFGAGAVWSAFATALIIPNVFRRLFGEGALSAAFIPEYTQLLKHDETAAHRLASLITAALLVLLGAITIAGEIGLALLLRTPIAETGGDVITFTMIMLPYMPAVCITALLGGMLQVHGRFIPFAAAPIILNVCMITAALAWAYGIGAEPRDTAVAISIAVVIAGIIQAAWCLWDLRTTAIWTRTVTGAGAGARRMLRRMGPVIIGMGTLQLSTLADGLIAGWPVTFGPTIAGIAYPLDTAAASALYYAQRLYQFPLGVFGIAVATAVFPALARAADDHGEYAVTLQRGIRLSLFIGVPATIGLWLVRHDLTTTIYAGGQFGAADTRRVADVLAAYAPAVWAYSLTHVLTRAFYARGETVPPMRIGVATVAGNLAISIPLIWILRSETGLAWGTSIAAMGQTIALAWLLARRQPSPLLGPAGRRSIGVTLASTVVMAGTVAAIQAMWPATPEAGWSAAAARLAVTTAAGAAVYGAAALLLRRPEMRWLLARR